MVLASHPKALLEDIAGGKIIRVSELVGVVDYDNIEKKLREYKAEEYEFGGIDVEYKPKLDCEDKERSERSGRLSIGFNQNYIDNSKNSIKHFCIYNDGIDGRNLQPGESSAKDVVASFKHSADRNVHQLAFNLTNLEGKTSTIGIAILLDCMGSKIYSDKEVPYLVLEGFTASVWFSDLRVKGEPRKSIYDFVINAINMYSKLKGYNKIFVNGSHGSDHLQQRPNFGVIKRLANLHNINYNRGGLIGCSHLDVNGSEFTHFMIKKKDKHLSNVHCLHTWTRYKLALEKDRDKAIVELEKQLASNKRLRLKVLYDLESRVDYKEAGNKKPFPRAWSECSGLVYGFEYDLVVGPKNTSPFIFMGGLTFVSILSMAYFIGSALLESPTQKDIPPHIEKENRLVEELGRALKANNIFFERSEDRLIIRQDTEFICYDAYGNLLPDTKETKFAVLDKESDISGATFEDGKTEILFSSSEKVVKFIVTHGDVFDSMTKLIQFLKEKPLERKPSDF